MTLNLNGLIPATVLPMHPDGSIDEPGLRRYIAWIVAQGPVSLAINVEQTAWDAAEHRAQWMRGAFAQRLREERESGSAPRWSSRSCA